MINSTIASTAFNQFELDAMGPASGQLAATWAGGAPTYDATAMTLTLAAGTNWHAMIGGLLIWKAHGASELTDATGASLSGVVGVFRFHPQAALRIRRLAGSRFDGRTDGSAARPIPFVAAIRGGNAPAEVAHIAESDPPLAPLDARVGSTLTHGTLTFHDELGLIIDPIAVACMFRDLMNGFPAMRNADAGGAGDLLPSGAAGGVGSIAAQATGRRVHIVDLFGGPWTDRPGAGIRIGTSARLSTSGPHDWPDGETMSPTIADAGDLRFGFSPEGTLNTTALSAPAFPGTVVPAGAPAPVLERQFLRVSAIDLGLHLRGNRTTDAIDGVPGVDQPTSREPAPSVSDGNTVDFLNDGQATTGAVSEVAIRSGLRLVVSPTIATNVNFPVNRATRWPADPVATETPEALDGERSRRAREDVTAVYVGSGPDVLLTWPAGSLPVEAHVRAFPRVDPGPAIVPLAERDFARRGDGASGIAKSAGLTLLVKDPYRVGSNAPPENPQFRFDLLVTTRAGGVQARLFGGLTLDVSTGATAPPEPAVTNALDAIPLNQRGISPSAVLELPPTAPAAGAHPVLSALGEAAPRESPRFRTMARRETMVVGHDGANPGVWQSMLTAGFLNSRSIRGDARLGNPGNPAGPEDHVPGINVTTRLGLALARAAVRRTHHLATRLVELNDARWNVPAVGSGSIAGAVLQNVADTVESPELAVLPESLVHDLPGNWSDLITAIQGLLPASLHSLIGAIPAPGAGDRWVEEVRREAFAAKHGRRDSQWSYRWAIAHARKLIYLESPLFGSTAAGLATHEVDLVAQLRERLNAAPDLRVVIAIPKRISFGQGYEQFSQYFHVARNEGINSLKEAAPRRVTVYHPIGFPGRPEVIRGTVAVIDDVWLLLGSSSFSRRGLTFDGSIDITLVDKTISRGLSSAISNFRRLAMARTLGVSAPAPGETANPNWVRLAQPRTAFELVREVVDRGGDGLVEPLWPGLPTSLLAAADRAIADPDGRAFPSILAGFNDLLAGLGQERV